MSAIPDDQEIEGAALAEPEIPVSETHAAARAGLIDGSLPASNS